MPLTPKEVGEFARDMQNISTMVYARGLTRRIAQAAAQAEREANAALVESFVPETSIFPATRKILLSAADAIRVSREQGGAPMKCRCRWWLDCAVTLPPKRKAKETR